eukprot:g6357.t1
MSSVSESLIHDDASLSIETQILPRGRQWLNKWMLSRRELSVLLSSVETSNEELRPYKARVVGDFARLLCTRDAIVIKNLFGMSVIGQILADRIDSVVGDKLSRGNAGCNGRINTNKSYWPRQLEFLEYLEENQELKTSLDDIVAESGRSKDEIMKICDWKYGKISLVCAGAGVSYLKSKKLSREAHDQYEEDKTTSGKVDEMFLIASSNKDGIMQRRRNKPVKEHLSESDALKYEGALNELRKVQLFLLGLQGMMHERLSEFYGFQSLMKQISRQHKQIELRSCFDKAHDGLHTLPSRHDLQDLYESWWNKAELGRLNGHSGLMNL